LVAVLVTILVAVAAAILIALLLALLLWRSGGLGALLAFTITFLFALPTLFRCDRRRAGMLLLAFLALALFLLLLWSGRAGWFAVLMAFSLLMLLSVGRPRSVRAGCALVSALRLQAQTLGVALGIHQCLPGALRRLERQGKRRLGCFGGPAERLFQDPLLFACALHRALHQGWSFFRSGLGDLYHGLLGLPDHPGRDSVGNRVSTQSQCDHFLYTFGGEIQIEPGLCGRAAGQREPSVLGSQLDRVQDIARQTVCGGERRSTTEGGGSYDDRQYGGDEPVG
jgi:hypothetical protein